MLSDAQDLLPVLLQLGISMLGVPVAIVLGFALLQRAFEGDWPVREERVLLCGLAGMGVLSAGVALAVWELFR